MFLSIKELSEYLKIKPSTLYDWTAQGKIPHFKIHGVIRFRKEEIDQWLDLCRKEQPAFPPIAPKENPLEDIDTLIEKAKRSIYNPPYRRPDRKSGRKGE
jgi:excisionase family DNA binding protein